MPITHQEGATLEGFVIRYRALGGWGWERFDEQGRLIDESHYEFETREECIEDAGARARSVGTEEHLSEQNAK